jgi:hypothetical protein
MYGLVLDGAEVGDGIRCRQFVDHGDHGMNFHSWPSDLAF